MKVFNSLIMLFFLIGCSSLKKEWRKGDEQLGQSWDTLTEIVHNLYDYQRGNIEPEDIGPGYVFDINSIVRGGECLNRSYDVIPTEMCKKLDTIIKRGPAYHLSLNKMKKGYEGNEPCPDIGSDSTIKEYEACFKSIEKRVFEWIQFRYEFLDVELTSEEGRVIFENPHRTLTYKVESEIGYLKHERLSLEEGYQEQLKNSKETQEADKLALAKRSSSPSTFAQCESLKKEAKTKVLYAMKFDRKKKEAVSVQGYMFNKGMKNSAMNMYGDSFSKYQKSNCDAYFSATDKFNTILLEAMKEAYTK
jgi:hypothetical protein